MLKVKNTVGERPFGGEAAKPDLVLHVLRLVLHVLRLVLQCCAQAVLSDLAADLLPPGKASVKLVVMMMMSDDPKSFLKSAKNRVCNSLCVGLHR